MAASSGVVNAVASAVLRPSPSTVASRLCSWGTAPRTCTTKDWAVDSDPAQLRARQLTGVDPIANLLPLALEQKVRGESSYASVAAAVNATDAPSGEVASTVGGGDTSSTGTEASTRHATAWYGND